jgi:hypothetical protein
MQMQISKSLSEGAFQVGNLILHVTRNNVVASMCLFIHQSITNAGITVTATV